MICSNLILDAAATPRRTRAGSGCVLAGAESEALEGGGVVPPELGVEGVRAEGNATVRADVSHPLLHGAEARGKLGDFTQYAAGFLALRRGAGREHDLD